MLTNPDKCARVTGHFGEWLQGRMGPDGPLVLLTVPCRALYVDVTRQADGALSLEQQTQLIQPTKAEQFLHSVEGKTGAFRVSTNMPVGGGAGSSTAALVALSRAARGREDRLVSACLDVEGASDPLMIDAPDSVVWASRQSRVVAHLPELPTAEIIGGFFGSPVMTDPNDTDFPDISDLASAVQAPLSLPELARIATTSAQRCTTHRGPQDDPSERLANELGALGYLRAHTGSARGFIFAPGKVPSNADQTLAAYGLKQVLRFQTGGSS